MPRWLGGSVPRSHSFRYTTRRIIKEVPIDHFADRLLEACRSKGSPVCVGLDPVYEKLPADVLSSDDLREMATGEASQLDRRAFAIHDYCSEVIDAVAEHVPAVKLQSACFERYGTTGLEVFHELTEQARLAGLIVIADCKRGDIGISAEHYAAACLADPPEDLVGEDEPTQGPDALTINAYLGSDGIEPFVKVGKAAGKGLFALVRTSNPGGDALQSLKLATGESVAEAVAKIIAQIGGHDSLIGQSGYSLLGAVVGATKASDAASLRAIMPQQIFLVPGFGAQGGKADDVKACFDSSGRGAIVTASRSVIYAYEKDKDGPWKMAIERAARQMKKDVNAAIGA